MGRIQKFSWLLVLIIALTLLPATQAAAAESGAIWFCQAAADDGATIFVCADTVVASGVITLTYDSDALTFCELTVGSKYVLAHAVNAQSPGQVQISWIAPAGYTAGDCYILMQLHFKGVSAENVALTGSAYGPAGEVITVTALDFATLEGSLANAEAQQAEEFTPDSFALLQAAVEEANVLLTNQILSQVQLDAAAQKIETALANLERIPPETTPTQPGTNPTEPETTPTQPATTVPVSSGNVQGGNGWIGIVIAIVAVCAAGAVVAVVILKKRGNQ